MARKFARQGKPPLELWIRVGQQNPKLYRLLTRPAIAFQTLKVRPYC